MDENHSALLAGVIRDEWRTAQKRLQLAQDYGEGRRNAQSTPRSKVALQVALPYHLQQPPPTATHHSG
jgi:hypothetical protein